MTGTLLLAVASLAFLSTSAAGQTEPRLSLLDVPYLSQTEALCGGAAVAMVLRYWGAAGATAEEFAPLVAADRAGIPTSALARAVEQRGYRTMAAAGTEAVVQRELADGRPVIALIEDRPDAFHYVVIVGWHTRAVVLHDPARTPYVLMKPADFGRRWKATGNWMLAVAPGRSADSESLFRVLSSESRDAVPVQSGCDALVADGVQSAQRNDLAAAERLLADAAYRCPGAAPLRELAGVRLLQRRWPEVRELAGRAVETDAADAHAWRLLATARYVTGDPGGALEAWNHAGEPKVDLVSVSGLQRTPHRVVEHVLGVAAGSVLTRSVSERARRRLDELPSAATTALEYVPRGSGAVELRAHVVERTVLPRGRLTWAAAGLRAAASRELAASISSLGHGGERLDVSWRFWPNRPAAGVAFHVPASVALFSLDLRAERQPFDLAAVPVAERLTTRLRAANWATRYLRWEASGGFTRWHDAGPFGTVGGAARFESRAARVGAEADVWLGDSTFATARLHGGWRSSASRRGVVLDLSSAAEIVAADAPLDLWVAGDTGQARRALLRAHPVLDDGRLRIDRLGRVLVHATAEVQHWWRAGGVTPIGAALFVDTARVTRRPSPAPQRALADVDVGAGFRLALPRGHGTFRADLAHGLRDGRNAFSVSWTPG